nr:hypothetical protein [Micromonospora sp. DSM 115978]
MAVLLQELGKRLAERWLTLLTMPGLLLVAVAVAGIGLGHRGWADLRGLFDRADRLVATTDPVMIGLLVAVGLVAATGAGLAATACGVALQRIWVGDWPGWSGWLERGLATGRHRRWRLAQDALDAELDRGRRDGSQDQRKLDDLAVRCNRIALAEPTRPTWIGDRVAAVELRVAAEYGLDLVAAWPRLWLLLPGEVRAELQEAAAGFNRSTVLGGWASLYLLIGGVWWPAALVGLLTAVVAWHRGRVTIGILADLAEATVDLHLTSLAERLGLPTDGGLTEQTGRRITARLRKGA